MAQAPQGRPVLRPATPGKYKEYKIILVMEGGLGTIFLGASALPIKKMEAAINQAASEGWQMVFQIIEAKRFLLFWKREAAIITLGR